MELIYEKTIEHSYMVLETENHENSYQIRMVKENKIHNFIPIHLQEKNGKERFYYDITSMENIYRFYKNREIGYEECKNLFLAIQNTLWKMKEYLLDENRLCLDERMIFYQELTGEYRFVFLPENQNRDFSKSLQILAEYLLERIDYEDNHAVQLVYFFYKEVRKEHFCLTGIIQRINEMEEGQELQEAEDFLNKEDVFEEETEENEMIASDSEAEPQSGILIRYLKTTISGGASMLCCCLYLLLSPQNVLGKIFLLSAVILAAFAIFFYFTRKDSTKKESDRKKEMAQEENSFEDFSFWNPENAVL